MTIRFTRGGSDSLDVGADTFAALMGQMPRRPCHEGPAGHGQVPREWEEAVSYSDVWTRPSLIRDVPGFLADLRRAGDGAGPDLAPDVGRLVRFLEGAVEGGRPVTVREVRREEAEWRVSSDPQEMLSLLGGCGRPSERKARLFLAAVCRRIWELLEDGRSRAAVEVAEQFADGLAGAGELEAARTAAEARSAGLVAWEPLQEAASAAAVACSPTAADVVCTAALDARQARGTAGRPGFDGGLWGSEGEAQCGLLRCLYGNPFRPAVGEPGWLTAAVLSIAGGAYEERSLPSGELDPVRLAVLADALEEAGCTAPDVLSHLRSPGPHVRGCWALDLVLGLA